MPELRSVMSLYPETITVLARAGADIHAPGDIVGMRVDVGHPASGRHGTTMQMLDALGLDRGDFLALRELPSDIAVDELCAGRIDATILVLGHPNNGVARALASCGARLVAVEGPGIDTWLGGSPDFVPATIPGDAYRMLTTDVPTYAVMATLVTRSDVPDALVADLVGITLEDRANIAQSAPVLDKLDPDDMPVLGLTAPLHPGAAEAYGLPGQ
jgi:hypothetical protein